MYQADRREGAGARVEVRSLSGDARYHDKVRPKHLDELEPQRERDKVDLKLREWLARRSGEEREQIVVEDEGWLLVTRALPDAA